MSKLTNAKEVAQYLNITESTVYRLTKEGKLPGMKIGNQWRYDMEVIIDLFKKGTMPKEDKEK
ncbi:MAG: helix-turn-helix domain-containing protein [Deltaproteobacteria bacterium]|nr:helix-turn-helix domain-containing protein [Deltaproteobacteria bacterium]